MTEQGSAAAILRAPRPPDVPELAELGHRCFVASFGHLYAPHDLAAYLAQTHDDAVVAERIAHPTRVYRVAELDGKLVGYAHLLLSGGIDHPTGAERPVTLSQLYCAPGTTGHGIGSALMNWAVGEAGRHGADELRLSVWSENYGAQRFYARHGFVHVADIDFWVGNHRDHEFLYALKL